MAIQVENEKGSVLTFAEGTSAFPAFALFQKFLPKSSSLLTSSAIQVYRALPAEDLSCKWNKTERFGTRKKGVCCVVTRAAW